MTLDTEKQRELQEERRKQLAKKPPHVEYYDKLYDAKLALEAAIGAIDMYQGHKTNLRTRCIELSVYLDREIGV